MWEYYQHKQPTMVEAKRHIREIYGENIPLNKYEHFEGSKTFIFLCILGLSMIPLEIFLKDVLTAKIENNLIMAV